jgi:Domain of unknown function (DUF4136)
MRMQTVAVAAALTLAGSVAFAQEVKVDFDKDANFGAIKTFAVKLGTSWNNPISEKRVTAEIEESLTQKGWVKTDEAKADAIVVLHGATTVKKDLNTFYSGGMGGYGWRGMGGMGMGTASTTVSEYTVGTLVVDIFNAKSKQLLFRGTASDEISDKAEKNQKKLAKASDKMFKDFPPGSAKK